MAAIPVCKVERGNPLATLALRVRRQLAGLVEIPDLSGQGGFDWPDVQAKTRYQLKTKLAKLNLTTGSRPE